jgi:hypothetical protein
MIKGRGMIKGKGMIKGRHLALQIFKATVFTTKYMINRNIQLKFDWIALKPLNQRN